MRPNLKSRPRSLKGATNRATHNIAFKALPSGNPTPQVTLYFLHFARFGLFSGHLWKIKNKSKLYENLKIQTFNPLVNYR